MTNKTVKRHLYVSESDGKANYSLFSFIVSESWTEYSYLGEIEVPAINDQALKEMALNGINAEIAKACLVLESLEIKKQTLLSIEHK